MQEELLWSRENRVDDIESFKSRTRMEEGCAAQKGHLEVVRLDPTKMLQRQMGQQVYKVVTSILKPSSMKLQFQGVQSYMIIC